MIIATKMKKKWNELYERGVNLMDPDRLIKIVELAFKIAKEDGIITEEEEKILKALKKGGREYLTALKEALADNIVTQEEYDRLELLWHKIVEKSTKVALDDEIITADERKLLAHIAVSISESFNELELDKPRSENQGEK